MIYKQTTQVPNVILDTHLPNLTESELKVLLIIIRQTFGWLDKRTGQRKLKDRISASQFRRKTGLSQRILTKTIQTLLQKKLITITDQSGAKLHQPRERQGKSHLYYSFAQPQHFETSTCAPSKGEHQHKGANDKTNSSKLIETKLRRRSFQHISQLLPQEKSLFRD
jgi:hypothetical protein